MILARNIQTNMTFTRLVTKCIAYLSPDDDHLTLDHCALCHQQEQYRPSKCFHPTHHQQVPKHNNNNCKSSTSSSSSAAVAKSATSHHPKRCCAKPHEPKEAKTKKTTANWKLNCAKILSGAISTCSSSASTSSTSAVASSSTHSHASSKHAHHTAYPKIIPDMASATLCGSAELPLNDTLAPTPPSQEFNEPTSLHPSAFPAASPSPNALCFSEDDDSSPSPIPTNEDCDKTARNQRAREIALGVDPPPGYLPMSEVLLKDSSAKTLESEMKSSDTIPQLGSASPEFIDLSGTGFSDTALRRFLPSLLPDNIQIHSQVDFMHCLVPDLKKITSSCFYWGKMDRYEAERLLDGKPEGTFLLRDSAQEEFLFSVSFRKYQRSLHARIEQFNHMFSFDCHDPAVATSPSVTGLLEHYKNPQRVMFFEPALTLPLNRNFCFSLQQLCRAAIVSQTSYPGIASLTLPVTLKSYLKEYHYKQRVRTKRYD